MYLGNERYEQIKKIITEVFEDYGICTIPIPVYELAEKMNISVIKYGDCSLEKKTCLLNASNDGLSFYDVRKKRFVIYCNNENCGLQRLRFTIMHEIAHIVLGHDYSNEEAESEADYFARNALAPIAVVMKKSILSPLEIMKAFDISYQCSEIVLRQLETKKQYNHMNFEKYDIDLLNLFNL